MLMLCSTVAQNILHVKPSILSAVVCPGQPCLTLGQYTEMANRYFATGSTLVFLAGNHSLHTVLSLANVSDMTLRGPGNSSPARIFLSNNATIRCENVGSFLIDGLKFKSATLRMNRCDLSREWEYVCLISQSVTAEHGPWKITKSLEQQQPHSCWQHFHWEFWWCNCCDSLCCQFRGHIQTILEKK